ncbi:peptidase M1 [Arachidicoccus ginsenosidimutans]|uniref:M1 family metallopeptidase n=1 Tax=Arachidicoccus sp. BS20 TaxID=1850526 RepID=UPI0007F1431E|nr:M1 family metallopeptidase [Arachidicoccus sp. BS20]ANI88418.1 peptidase M1 [Arachidicoccus sp. BS20]
MKSLFILFVGTIFSLQLNAQLLSGKEKVFTHADTLRGSVTPERAWWDVLRYDITVKPDYETKSIVGKNVITYFDNGGKTMQIDMQEPMEIDSISDGQKKYQYRREGNAYHVFVRDSAAMYKIKPGVRTITIYYHGNPRIAIKAPWDGGWIFTKDSLGRPWMTVACQGLGASVWYPCKDYQGDEPDSGAGITTIVPDTLVAVANGKLIEKKELPNHLTSYKWAVKNPINNYDIVPYIGKYTLFDTSYNGLKGKLDVALWALDYDMNRMKVHCKPDVFKMLKALEYWYGAYPFYEDGYKLVEAPHLGMEHQSDIAYGNHFLQGYLGRDLSHTGIGLKFDFIVVHESGHEWFGNSITSKDIADMWIHESFTNYCEALFTEYYWGKKEAQDYVYGIRQNIENDEPIIGHYSVNDEGSGDMYYKGANMINNIRHSINDDDKFRALLHGINKAFYHQTITSKQIEDYINQFTGIDFSKVFQQYLTTTQIPVLELYFSDNNEKINYRYINCVAGFNMPIVLHDGNHTFKFTPTTEWQSKPVKTADEANMLNPIEIEGQYYLTCKIVQQP